MMHCPSCGKEILREHVEGGAGECPHCGTSVLPEHLRAKSFLTPQILNTSMLRPFEHVDQELYDRIRDIEPTHGWPLAVMAEIVEHEYSRLSFAMNHAPEVSGRFFSFAGRSSLRRGILERFTEFVDGLAEVQDVLSKDLHSSIVAADMKELCIFYDHLNECTDWLIKFQADLAGLRHIGDSVPQKIQFLMLDWVQHVLICFERLAKQLRRKSGMEPHLLQEHSVQVSIAPCSLPTFFQYLNQLSG